MALLLLDRDEEQRLIRERQESGGDRYDEVWDGVYVMSPLANLEHQRFAFQFAAIIQEALGWDSEAVVLAGANVSDRDKGWTKNYRVPDVTVTFPGGKARDCGTHWMGGPDFVIEVVSADDRSREKFDFYAAIGVRELLLLDRAPWSLELYRLADGVLALVGKSDPDNPAIPASEVLPLCFRLVAGGPRPTIEAVHSDGVRRWSI